jgi:hypothetical protein
MNAQEFLTTLERRGFKVGLSPGGGFTITPSFGLTGDDRANFKLLGKQVVRLVCERESPTPGLSPADAQMIAKVKQGFPGTKLIEIRAPQPRQPSPALEPSAPAVQSTDRNKEKTPMPKENTQPPLPLAASKKPVPTPPLDPVAEPEKESDDDLIAAHDAEFPDSACSREEKISIQRIMSRIRRLAVRRPGAGR